MITPILTAALVALAGPSASLVLHRLPSPGEGVGGSEGPRIELWTDRNDGTIYHRGERVRVYFRPDQDAYVTVFHINTDGRVRVLFPEDPWEDNFARGGHAYEVRPRDDRYAVYLDEYPGQGYLFAIATRDPFDYHAVVRGDHWDYQVIAGGGRISGDPYVSIQDLVDLIVPANYDAYSYDVTTYYVEQYHEYPRFLCYDCHSYVSYPYWDPYHYSCLRFRIVIYDDPYYYPARAYPATRVVYRRVARVEPRYVFKDRGPTDPYVIRVRQRPVEPGARRADERGATGRDVGGVGAVPAPAPGARGPVGRVPEPAGAQGAEQTRRPEILGPGPVTRQPEPIIDRRAGGQSRSQPEPGQPVTEPRRLPARGETPPATVRPREPGGAIAPVRDQPPQVFTPRSLDPRQPVRIPDQERPRLEPREPPARSPEAGPPRERPPIDTRPPAAQPREPAAKASPPQKKPEVATPRRKPGG
jgi:hypothetical protein